MKSLNKKIAAAAALSKIAEIRQFRLVESYEHLSHIEDVLSVNEEAKKTIGIDMLDESKVINFEGFEKYEQFLERIIENNLSTSISKTLLADEMEMLKNSSRIPLNTFREYKINIISNVSKEVAKALGIIPNSILGIVKDSSRVELIAGDDENILALSRSKVKLKPVFFLSHISKGPFKNQLSTTPNSFEIHSSATLDGTSYGITVLSLFAISPENPLLDEDSLVPVFLQAMSKYSKDIRIGNQTKKFFYHGINSSLMIDPSGKAVLNNTFNSFMYAVYSVKKTQTGYAYSFTYSIDIELIRNNYRRSIYLS